MKEGALSLHLNILTNQFRMNMKDFIKFCFKAPDQTVNKHLLHLLFWFSSVSTKEDQFSVSIQPAVGELLMPSTMTEEDFCKEQGQSSVCQIHELQMP